MSVIEKEQVEVQEVTRDELLEAAALAIEEHGFTTGRLLHSPLLDEDDFEASRTFSVRDGSIDGLCAVGAIWRAAANKGLLPSTFNDLANADDINMSNSAYAQIGAVVGMTLSQTVELARSNDAVASKSFTLAKLRSLKENAC